MEQSVSDSEADLQARLWDQSYLGVENVVGDVDDDVGDVDDVVGDVDDVVGDVVDGEDDVEKEDEVDEDEVDEDVLEKLETSDASHSAPIVLYHLEGVEVEDLEIVSVF